MLTLTRPSRRLGLRNLMVRLGLRRTPSPDSSSSTQAVESWGPLLLVSCVGVAVSQTWFRSGAFIATGDIPPFVHQSLRGEFLWLWNHENTGAGSRSYAAARALEVAFTWLTSQVGAGDVLGQRLYYGCIMGAAAFGAAYFAAAFMRDRVALIFAGLVAVVNPFLLTHLPNPIPPLAVAIAGVLGGLVLRAAAGGKTHPVVFAVVSIASSYLMNNPPLLLVTVGFVIMAVALGTALTGSGGTSRAAGFILSAMPLTLVLNLWWLAPALLTLVGPTTESTGTAGRDIRDWAWTHRRNSLPNVFTLNSTWGWSYPEYFPYARRLDHPSWVWMRYVLPSMALMAPSLTEGRKRRASLLMVAGAVVLVLFSTGLHGPLAPVNLWLYDHVPGLWLLRDPLSKLGVPLLLLYCALATLTIAAIAKRLRTGSGSGTWLWSFAIAIAVSAPLVYPIPLWNGQLVPDRRPLLPSGHVKLPPAWREAARFVDTDSSPGKALVLPVADFYQMPTTWGYYGVDTIPKSLIRRPVIQPQPDSYFGEESKFLGLVTSMERDLATGDVSTVPSVLRALGVSHVLLRRDLDTAYPGRSFVPPDRLEAGLRAVPGLRLKRTNAVVEIYEYGEPGSTIRAAEGRAGRPARSGQTAGSSLAEDLPSSFVTGMGIEGEPAFLSESGSSSTLRVVESGPYIIRQRQIAEPQYSVRVVTGDDGPQLRFYDANVAFLDGQPLSSRPELSVPLPSESVSFVRVDGAVSRVDDSARIRLRPDSNVTLYGSGMSEDLLGPFGPLGDCNKYDNRSVEQLGLAAQVLPDGVGGSVYRLSAQAHSACISAPIRSGMGEILLKVSFEHRSLAGSPPRFCLLDSASKRCLHTEPLTASRDWSSVEAEYVVEGGVEEPQLVLYGDESSGSDTQVEYRHVKVSGITELLKTTLSPSFPPADEFNLGAGSHELLEPGKGRGHLGPFSPVGDCNAYKRAGDEALGFSAAPLVGEPGPAFRLTARSHIACISAPLEGYVTGEPVRLRLEYRNQKGAAARICLLQLGPGTCAPGIPMKRTAEWTSLDATVSPSAGTTGISLFLYADGEGGPTVTEYRQVALTGAGTTAIEVTRARGSGRALPLVSVKANNPSSYAARIVADGRPFILVLSESFDSGWRLENLGDGVTVRHVRVDGYANGWEIEGAQGVLNLGLRYSPAAHARLALLVSSFAGLLLSVGFSVRLVVAASRKAGRARRGVDAATASASVAGTRGGER